MDIDIVNTILRLCFEQKTCLFELPILFNYCREQHLCTDPKHILASVRNYEEIFKISRNRSRIEFHMPFQICRNNGSCRNNGQYCSNLHVCYDHFTSLCRRSTNCPFPHVLTGEYDKNTLQTLINLDLEALTKAFRVYCQSRKRLLNSNSISISSLKGLRSTLSSLIAKNSTTLPLSSSTNDCQSSIISQINPNISWKTNNRTVLTSNGCSRQQRIITKTSEASLRICWTPQNDIENHFVEVIFSNQDRSNGSSIRSHTLYQHLGIADVLYQNSDTTSQVIHHGPVIFHKFTFTPGLIQHTIDTRHICFLTMSNDINHIRSFIDSISKSYPIKHFEYYQNDQNTILVEYNEDIDFSKLFSSIQYDSEYERLKVKCIQLYCPEILLVEYDHEYTENDLRNLFTNEIIFHVKIYSLCAFIHFYSHDGLMHSLKISLDKSIRVKPIYFEVYSQDHLNNYLRQRQLEIRSKHLSTLTNDKIKQETLSSNRNDDFISKSECSTSSWSSPTSNQQTVEIHSESKSFISKEITSSLLTEDKCSEYSTIRTNQLSNIDDNENHKDETNIIDDLPSEFDDDDLLVNEDIDHELQHSISLLNEMEQASENIVNPIDEPHLISYGDDYLITMKCRRFALAFLDYIQFRLERQLDVEDDRLWSLFKKNRKHLDDKNQNNHSLSTISKIDPDLSVTLEAKLNKKKYHKRNKKKTKNFDKNKKDEFNSNHDSSINEHDDDNHNNVHNIPRYNRMNSSVPQLPDVYLDDDLKPCTMVIGEDHNEEDGLETNECEVWHNIVAGGRQVSVSKTNKQRSKIDSIQNNSSTNIHSSTVTNICRQANATESNSLIISNDCRGFIHHPKLQETFRLCLRRSFSSVNIDFDSDTYTIMISGNIKLNIRQQCLNYLKSLNAYKCSVFISHENFPQTTITSIIRMQQSTALINLDRHADYNRIFRSTYRLIDYQLKQSYNQQQCIYCRRSKKQFKVTYLKFPCEKQTNQELNDSIQQRVQYLLNQRFTYVAMVLSADLMTTKRWTTFYKNLSKHKELNKNLLLKKVNTIIQIYGSSANVQQIQVLLTKFVDANRYETDVIESEQAQEIYSLFKNDFKEMENLEIFRNAELRFVYRHRRHCLLFQCFQERFEMVKNRIQRMRSQLKSIVLPVKSPVLSRYYSKSNRIQHIAEASTCIITIEQHIDDSQVKDYLINLKIFGRSSGKITLAQQLIEAFEEQQYSTQKIHNDNIKLFTEHEIELLKSQCSRFYVSYAIDQRNDSIELEGLSEDFVQIEKVVRDLCSSVAQRALDHSSHLTECIYYDKSTDEWAQFGSTIKRQLEKFRSKNQLESVNLKDQKGHNHVFNLDKKTEIIHGRNLNTSLVTLKTELHDVNIQLPAHWSPMRKSWDRVFLGRREDVNEWKNNFEIQQVIKLPNMLPESWIIEIHRIQNPSMFRQYFIHKAKIAGRCVNVERILYRLAPDNLIDDMCARGFNQSHTDSALSTYGHGCHFYCKAKDIDRTATLLAKNLQMTSIGMRHPTSFESPVRYLFVCKVLVGNYTLGDSSMTCPPDYDSLVDNISSPEIFVTCHDSQVLPEYLIAYRSDIF